MRALAIRSVNHNGFGGLALLFAATLTPGTVHAAPGVSATATGTAEASVIERLQIVPDDTLRFGQFTRPTAAGTLTITTAGGASATAGMTTTYTIPQAGTGRGPATFHLLGNPNRSAIVIIPNRFDISNGAATMRVDNVTINNSNVNVRLNSIGYFQLVVGGRLNVAANQAPGYYSGTFDISVNYQ